MEDLVWGVRREVRKARETIREAADILAVISEGDAGARAGAIRVAANMLGAAADRLGRIRYALPKAPARPCGAEGR